MTDRRNLATVLLAGVTCIALYLSYLLFRPYTTPILFACVIAIVFHPLHRTVERIIGSRNGSASVSTILTLLFTLAPLAFLLVAISNELSGLYQTLTVKSSGEGGLLSSVLHATERVTDWVAHRLSLPSVDLQQILMRRLEDLSSSLVRLGAALVTNVFSLVVNAMIAVVMLFFLFRDGESFVTSAISTLPFPQEQLVALRRRISSTIISNLYGGVAVGALQGTLTGISFWALGLDSPVLWGVVTGFFSLVPVIGSAAVWVPAAIALLASGHIVKGIILLAVGAAVIGTVDNIVRPLILHSTVRLHMILVFFALLGGLRIFGVLGVFVGPVILSVTAALLAMLKDDLASRREMNADAAR